MTTYDDLREVHAKGFNSASDEAWERDPICLADGNAWPCDTAKALDLIEHAQTGNTEPTAADLEKRAEKAQSVEDIINASCAVIAEQSDIWAANSARSAMHRVAKAARAEGRLAAEKMRGDVHHHVNSVIGLLRHDFQSATGVDPFDIEEDSEWGLRPLDISHSRIISTLRTLQDATDAADAALGEKPMREQIADLHTQMAADRAAEKNENGPTS